MAVKSLGEISFRSTSGVDIEDEFGDVVGLDNSQTLFNQSTYLSGFYRGLTRLASEGTQTKHGVGQYRYATYYGGPVTEDSMHRYMVTFDPNASASELLPPTDGYGRSDVFETEIISTQFGTGVGFDKQELDFYSPSLVLPFDARNMYVSNPVKDKDEYGVPRYYTNGSLYSVESLTNGKTRLNYWLGYAKKGVVHRLPSLQEYTELLDGPDIMDGVARGDMVIAKADVPFGLDRSVNVSSIEETIIGTPTNSQSSYSGFGGSYISQSQPAGPDNPPNSAMELHGRILAVGSQGDDTNSAGSGSVYIYKRGADDNDWTLEATLNRSSDGITEFGRCIALSGNGGSWAALRDGAYREGVTIPSDDKKVLAVSGKGADGKHNRISMYLRSQSGVWTLRTTIAVPDDYNGTFPTSTESDDVKGINCLSLSDDGFVLAAGIRHSLGSTSNIQVNKGRVEAYYSSSGPWLNANRLSAIPDIVSDVYGGSCWAGTSVALSGDGNTLTIGVPKIEYLSDMVSDAYIPVSLRAEIMTIGLWLQYNGAGFITPSQRYVVDSDHRTGIGFNVDASYDGRMIVAGGVRKSADNSLVDKGVVQIIERQTIDITTAAGATAAEFTLTSEVTAPAAEDNDFFGTDVKLDMPAPTILNYPTGGTLIVGAKNRNTRQGAAYVFTNILPTPEVALSTSHTWIHQKTIIGSQAESGTSINPVTGVEYPFDFQIRNTGSQFGLSVDIDGLYAVVLGNTNHYNDNGRADPRGKLYLYKVDSWKGFGTPKSEYVANPFSGRYGIGTIPLSEASESEIKFSHFYGATKKPAIWEAIADLYKRRHQTIDLSLTQGAASSLDYGTDNSLSDALKVTRAMFHHSARNPDFITGETIREAQLGENTTLDRGHQNNTEDTSTTAIRTATDLVTDFHFGRAWGDMTLGETSVVRDAQKDYTWTTVLIHHTGINILDQFGDPINNAAADTYGWMSYGGGNAGGNSTLYSHEDTQFFPTRINGTTTDGADEGLNDLRAFTSAYTTGSDSRSPFPLTLGTYYNLTSRWYIAHIPLPVNEISNIKRQFRTTHSYDERHQAQNIHLFPGKWEYVSGSFKHGEGQAAIGTYQGSGYEHGYNCQQNVNYGDLSIFCAFNDEAVFSMRPDLTYCNIPDNHSHDWSFDEVQPGLDTNIQSGHQTRFNITMDPLNPENTSAAGRIAYETRRKAGNKKSHNDFFNHGTDMQSFILRCSDT